MKRTLLLTLLLPLFALASFANGTEIDGIYYELNNEAKTASVTYTGEDTRSENTYTGSITIPSSITCEGTEYTVTDIGNSAFSNCTGLEKIGIPNSVTYIGRSAFQGCTSLKSVDIPNSVTGIGMNAFRSCTSLTSVVIPNSLARSGLNFYAFRDCPNLKSVTLNCGKAAQYMTSFVNIFGDQVEELTIGKDVTTFHQGAFSMCKNLTKVTINSNELLSRCNESYYSSTSMVSLFGNQVKTYIIGEGVETIGGRAFFAGFPEEGDQGLTFAENALETVVLPSTLRTIGRWAFQYCINLRSINIPEGVDSIGDGAFTWCHNLEALNLPASLRVPGDGHNELFKVAAINVAEGNPYLRSEDGVLLSADGKILWLYPSGKTDEAYRIPDGVEEIRGYAFDGTTTLRNLTLPASMKTIGTNPFYNVGCIEELTVEAAEPPTTEGGLFLAPYQDIDWLVPSGYDFYSSVTLRVPVSSRELYAAHSEWGKFTNITEFEPTSISLIEANHTITAPYYDMQGRRVDNPQRGVYIQNGRKVYIR